MAWKVEFHDDFDTEFEALPEDVQDALLERLGVLAEFGPTLGRPLVDRLHRSDHQNMKEIRFNSDGVWRFAFAFDPLQNAIVLCGGDKEGLDQKAFYIDLISLADKRFKTHVEKVKAQMAKEAKERRQNGKK